MSCSITPDITPDITPENPSSISPIVQERRIEIGPRTLLFDLNENQFPFWLTFEVESEQLDQEFFVRILTQDQLSTCQDSIENDDFFKKTKGMISGKVKSGEDATTHFLALRSPSPQSFNATLRVRLYPGVEEEKMSEPSSLSSESSLNNTRPVPSFFTNVKIMSTKCMSSISDLCTKRWVRWSFLIIFVLSCLYFFRQHLPVFITEWMPFLACHQKQNKEDLKMSSTIPVLSHYSDEGGKEDSPEYYEETSSSSSSSSENTKEFDYVEGDHNVSNSGMTRKTTKASLYHDHHDSGINGKNNVGKVVSPQELLQKVREYCQSKNKDMP